MTVPPSVAWKLVLAIVLAAGIVVSARAQAPRQTVPGYELRRLMLAALTLYLVGGLASATHHQVLAGMVYAAGIGVCALAAWLSRGQDSEDPPADEEPPEEHPPPEPDGAPGFDWEAFERELREWSRSREPAGRS